MSKREMPKRPSYEIFKGIWDSSQYMLDLESFTRSILQELEEKEEENQRLRERLEEAEKTIQICRAISQRVIRHGVSDMTEMLRDIREASQEYIDSYLSESQKGE